MSRKHRPAGSPIRQCPPCRRARMPCSAWYLRVNVGDEHHHVDVGRGAELRDVRRRRHPEGHPAGYPAARCRTDVTLSGIGVREEVGVGHVRKTQLISHASDDADADRPGRRRRRCPYCPMSTFKNSWRAGHSIHAFPGTWSPEILPSDPLGNAGLVSTRRIPWLAHDKRK
ncbi:hypothetical protein MAPG_09438 [Magnaporthiopsis poae ATCC 64411]|uniref:Uncharacterized protein n=1 Tax=Magnaporthiopsis poae (strain ATCC 64411 / 73-15) TaxID=644358 RepID=A0A0C4E9Y6_MAGP6|nr:hypothetical protein MAPG_09438 [Magnaporthiopsis poae ATCC 64411]